MPHDSETKEADRPTHDDEDDGKDKHEDGGGEDGDEKGGKKGGGGKDDKKGKGGDEDKGEGDKGKDEEGKGEDGKDKGGKNRGGKKSRWPIVLLVLAALLAVAVGAVYWLLTRDQVSTDDAYTEGNAVSIAPKVSGYVVERYVDDNSFVRAGDLMLRVDPRDYINARDMARSNLDLAQAQLRSAEIQLDISRVRFPADRLQATAQLAQAKANQANAGREYQRQRSVDPRATTQATVDQATDQFQATTASMQQAMAQKQVADLVDQNIADVSSTVKQRQAQVEQAAANLAQAELNLSYTEIHAPQDGFVTRRNVDVGTYAQAGQQAFYLVPPDTWVVANFKETQMDGMRVGQRVDIDVDAYPSLKLHGHVQSIQQGAGARFTTFPAENATGNFVKIVRRVPVKIVIDSGVDQKRGLPLGLSVEPTVFLK